MNLKESEKKNKIAGIVATVVFHAILLLIFFFGLAWKPPYPPPNEIGLELALGIDDQGSGEAVQENATEETTVEEPESEETEETKAENSSESVEEPIETTETTDETADVSASTPEETTTETTEESSEASQFQAPSYPNTAENNSESGKGDDQQDGNKGREEGNIDDRAIMNSSGEGGGGGASYSMSGWAWDAPPKIIDRSAETGKIIFTVTINDEGEILTVGVKESTVSSLLVNKYKEEIFKQVTFSPVKRNVNLPPKSSGTITFIIKSR